MYTKSSLEVAQVFNLYIFARFSVPLEIIVDLGTKFARHLSVLY